jgi:hypothetical protein
VQLATAAAAASKTVVYAGEVNTLAVGLGVTDQGGGTLELRTTVLGQNGPASGLDVAVGVDGKTATASACGAGCYRATLSGSDRPRAFSVRVRGTTLRFAAPTQWPAPEGLQLVRRAEQTITGLHSLVVRSRLRSDASHEVTTLYKMVAPDRLEYHNLGGGDSIIIGQQRWDRDAGGKWVESPQIPALAQPAPFWPTQVTDAHVLRTARVDGRPVWVVSFLDPATPAWFTVWIDRSSYRTLRLDMVAAAHFMRDRDGPFNAPIKIEPPGP